MTVKEIIKLSTENAPYSIRDAEKLFNFKKKDCMQESLQTMSFKHYDLTTNVYKCDDGFVGVTGAINNRKHKKYEEFAIPVIVEPFKKDTTFKYSYK